MFNSTKNKPQVCCQLEMHCADTQFADKCNTDDLIVSLRHVSGYCLNHFLTNNNDQQASHLQFISRRVNDSFKLNTQLP